MKSKMYNYNIDMKKVTRMCGVFDLYRNKYARSKLEMSPVFSNKLILITFQLYLHHSKTIDYIKLNFINSLRIYIRINAILLQYNFLNKKFKHIIINLHFTLHFLSVCFKFIELFWRVMLKVSKISKKSNYSYR